MPVMLSLTQGLHQRPGLARTAQRGLSLVELMVGITVGLIVVAAASVMVSGQLAENRRLVAEAQVQQDLRASVDIITRELRRAGSSTAPVNHVWGGSGSGDAAQNTSSTLAPASGSSSEVTFSYQVATVDAARGFRLNATDGTIESLQGAAGWQELTDRNTIEVTEFTVTRLPDATAMVQCPNACTGGGGATDCWPRVAARALELTVVVRSRVLPDVERRHQSVVRLRNDLVPFAGGTNLCPA